MIVECISNDGFEDQLTVGRRYPCVIEGGSVNIIGDTGHDRWYGSSKFKVVL